VAQHVGDSLHHDVVGANTTGIDSISVAGGVHREELGSKLGEIPFLFCWNQSFDSMALPRRMLCPFFKM
jgi:ribonucleotide monophosphatase NagD (HAD superfamily)